MGGAEGIEAAAAGPHRKSAKTTIPKGLEKSARKIESIRMA